MLCVYQIEIIQLDILSNIHMTIPHRKWLYHTSLPVYYARLN
jgi:hypothetical protein